MGSYSIGRDEMERNGIRGFTLIELMIVVVIIGILAAMAIPNFNDITESANRNACRANMRTIASQEVIFFAANGVYTDALDDLGLGGVVCPGTPAAHTLSVGAIGGSASQSFTIVCPNTPSHGNIDNGVASWVDHI